MRSKYLVILLSLPVVYGGGELYFYFSQSNLSRSLENARITRVGEPIKEEGLYIARGRLEARRPAAIPGIIGPEGNYLAIHFKVEVFQRHEDSHRPGNHTKVNYSYSDVFSEKPADAFYNDKVENPNPKQWPIDHKSTFAMGSDLVFKNGLKLDEKELARKWNLFKQRYLLERIDFTPPEVANRTPRRVRAGVYLLERVPGKTSIGDIRLSLSGLSAGGRIIMGAYRGGNRLEPWKGNGRYYFWPSTHWSDAQLKQRISALVVGGRGFYVWVM